MDGKLGLVALCQISSRGKCSAFAILDGVRDHLGFVDYVVQLFIGCKGNLDALVGMDLRSFYFDSTESGFGSVEGYVYISGMVTV